MVHHIRTRGGLVASRRLPLMLDNTLGTAYNIVIDHVSMAWSTDELMASWWGAHDITWSHVLATGELRNTSAYHDANGKVMITDSSDYNLLVRNSALLTGYQRMPLAQANSFVFVNNIVYNWGGVATQYMRQNAAAGGELVLDNNHYRTGPLNAQAWSPKPVLLRDQLVPGFHVYMNGNYAPDFSYSRQWDLVSNRPDSRQSHIQVSAPGAWPQGLVAKSAANDGIFDAVLNNVGAFPLHRDSLDAPPGERLPEQDRGLCHLDRLPDAGGEQTGPDTALQSFRRRRRGRLYQPRGVAPFHGGRGRREDACSVPSFPVNPAPAAAGFRGCVVLGQRWLLQGMGNGVLKLDHRGPTLYAGQGVYLKLANYHSAFGSPSSVIHDRIIRGTTWRDVSLTPLQGVS